MPRCDVTAGHYYSQLMTTAHTSCHWPAAARFTEHGQLGIVTCYRPASSPTGHAPCSVSTFIDRQQTASVAASEKNTQPTDSRASSHVPVSSLDTDGLTLITSCNHQFCQSTSREVKLLRTSDKMHGRHAEHRIHGISLVCD